MVGPVSLGTVFPVKCWTLVGLTPCANMGPGVTVLIISRACRNLQPNEKIRSGVHVLIFECRLVLSRCAVVCGCSIFFPKNLVDEIWEMPFQAAIFKSKSDYQITIAGFLDVGANQVME